MIRSTLAFAIALGIASPVAHAQLAAVAGAAAPAGTAGLGGLNGVTQGFNGNQVTPQFVMGLFENGQNIANGQNFGGVSNGGFRNSGNNGFGYYSPPFAVGGGGFGLSGINSFGNGYYGNSGFTGAYGSNSMSSLLQGRTLGNLYYYGPPSTMPNGINNLNDLSAVGLMPGMRNTGNMGNNGNLAAISGPNTRPAGIVGSTRGNSEASAILNGSLPTRTNPRASGKTAKGRAAAKRAR